MKKLAIVLCLLIVSIAAKAQFERGKWMVNAQLSNIGLSYSNDEKGHFGVSAGGGYFLLDNIALTASFGMDMNDDINKYSFGLGGRYYFEQNGLFLGGGIKARRYAYDNAPDTNDFGLSMEGGYAFFLSRTVTIEPSVYYDLSMKNGDNSKIGAKVGFSLYF
jgi:hypothetical protein